MHLKVFLSLLQRAIQKYEFYCYLTPDGQIRLSPQHEFDKVFCPITAVEYFRFGHMVPQHLADRTTTDYELITSNNDEVDVISASDRANPRTPFDAKLREKLFEVCKLPRKDS